MGMAMNTPRRFLPPTSLLKAFEVTARTGTITMAARELSLTQSAVSRQIMALEAQLGAKLFTRERQTLRLTVAGEAYAREIRDALQKIAAASLNLRANPFGGTLNLATLPTFGARWLTPKLPAFLKHHPGIMINLLTRISRFDFKQEPFDAAIHYGLPDWPDTQSQLICEEHVVSACSPAFFARHALSNVESVRTAPLLHLTTRPDAWELWFAHHGLPPENVHGMLFDQFSTLTQAAIAGLGVALLPEFLIAQELQSGELVRVTSKKFSTDGAYHLIWPNDRSTYQPLLAFRDWIVATSKSEPL
jgi:LysR family transcriptional regulator, glycine cleavage system transcriptional activator